ncbi:uncharacterized protein FIBRA_01920 [Fibroporia radiculosa]|uniref:DNA replication ATP-dependent helicase/nuclease DNA2 n=1 Tax=Fibroporia radiculosa TaxID=599839 RepID=J4GLV2_9APHY|nr:uncharacterized protein FIBRA_01920 [Fibroporia radiculosa]CCL99895.1 predicted protein [Fibroporia radiculosa]
MPPVARSEEEEADFMTQLLAESEGSHSSADTVRTSRTTQNSQPPRTPPRSRDIFATHTSRILATPQTPARTYSAQDVDVDQLLAGAEDWDWDDMNSDCLSPKKNKSPKKVRPAIHAPPKHDLRKCIRCSVKHVTDMYDDSSYQKDLVVEVIPGHECRRVILRDGWITADVRPGDIVNIIGDFSVPLFTSDSMNMPSISISSKSNFFIHHPDLLITATALSSAPQCLRKPLISNLVRGSVDVTPSLVWGTMLHEVMQTCLSEGCWDEKFVEARITDEVGRGLSELMRINTSVEQATIEMKARARGIKSFADKYIAQEPKSDAILTNTRAAQGQTSLLAISKLHDIEEDIWSPTYGIKGKIDASVNAVISEVEEGVGFFKGPAKTTTQNWTMPFEIKTGRAGAGMEHRAQTMLYTLLMAERYGSEVPSGLLYYTRSDEVVRVPAARNEIHSLLVARNELAGYMMRRMGIPRPLDRSLHDEDIGGGGDDPEPHDIESFLPPTIDDSWQCGRCYALDTCMLYRKAAEEVVDTTSPIADIYALKTSHITREQGAFFKKWEALIALEEQDLIRFKKELWTMGAREREMHGRCFSDMILDVSYFPVLDSREAAQHGARIHRFTYRFTKSSKVEVSLLNGHMSFGDAITVSVEPDLLALARGFIIGLTPQELVVGVDHELDLQAILERKGGLSSEVIFRIDKDELATGMGRIRENIAHMFYADGDSRRLSLVVDLTPPQFDEIGDFDTATPPLSKLSGLNSSQRIAVSKVLSAQDYALILGMPGTGKTTVIAAIIHELVSMGKTVLLASYTHSAVDNVLLKLKHTADFGILRVGNLDKIHPDAFEFTLASRRAATNIEQLEQQVMTPPVIATTCLSLDHPLFSRRKFDYCIVDEASQITLPTCLGPLRFADKFVLVGDHFQLPPLVRNRAARRGGLDISLFRRLSDAHPHAVVDLTEQYRMNEDIMLLSNKLIYSGRLHCGSDEVAKRTLTLPNRAFLQSLHATRQSRCKVVFVDTDAVPAHDSPVGDLVENRIEAQLLHQVAESLIRSGVRQDQIGVLSLYRQQIKLLSYYLQDRKEVEVLTADRSQGRDKDCILISMVRSNAEGQVGDLVKDWRRMNVSFTRARSKLIIFGSRSTLQGTSLLKEFFELMESKGWILRLPANAHEMHILPACGDFSKKRPAEDDSYDSKDTDHERKRGRRIITVDCGLLKGRPILKDLANAVE